ncbi:hypothetical protein [Nocardioides sp. L-11A]|uniref:hypothetical protein n=1 Tax=Nocardioides sp. L-11A TaxID=3043848 RepID=UPI00249C1068|nr:hypothetical protein QJ852_23120 [Nocardioides sp. L-11A]
MKNHLVRRSVAALALGSLAAVGLASVPSPARAAVEDGEIGGWSSILADGCEGPEEDEFEPDVVSWTDNNVTVSKNTSASSTFTVGEDSVDATTSTSASISASPIGSAPATITGSATATTSVRPSSVDVDCFVRTQAAAVSQGYFTLTQPMWVTLTATGQGQREGETLGTSIVGIGSADLLGGSGWESLLFFGGLGGDGLVVSAGNRGSAVSSTLLPPGKYGVGFSALAVASTHQLTGESESAAAARSSASHTGSFKVELKPAGTASAVTGKGAPLVQFGERDCTNGNVTVALSKKTVKKAKRVKFKVDGAKAAVLKGKGLKGKKPKARTVVLPTSASGVTKVKVKLVLANGRRMQATRSYLPCT